MLSVSPKDYHRNGRSTPYNPVVIWFVDAGRILLIKVSIQAAKDQGQNTYHPTPELKFAIFILDDHIIQYGSEKA